MPGEPDPRADELLALSRELRRLARQLASSDVSDEDLVQEAWLAALSSSPDRIRDLRKWLKATMRNLARRAARRQSLREDRERRAGRDEAHEPAVELASESELGALHAEITRLREPLRGVIVLRFLRGRSLEEVASELGRPLETVRTQQRRALAELREAFERREARRHRLPALFAWLRRPARTGARAALFASLAVVAVLTVWLARCAPRDSAALAPMASAEAAPGTFAPAEIDANARSTVAVAEPLPATVPTPAAESVAFHFRVLSLDGVPVAGATVALKSRGDLADVEFSSAADGRCVAECPESRLSDLARAFGVARSVTAIARAPGHARSQLHIVSAELAEREIELRLGGPESKFVGRVIDSRGDAVPGARIELVRRDSQVGTPLAGVFTMEAPAFADSGADGSFEIANVQAGEYGFSAVAQGFAPTVGRSVADAAAPATIVLERGATLVGRVALADGTPAAGATVELSASAVISIAPPRVVADELGLYRIDGIEPGKRWAFAWTAHGRADTRLELPASGEVTWDPVLASARPLAIRLVSSDASPVRGGVVELSTLDLTFARWRVQGAAGEDGVATFDAYPQAELRCDVFAGRTVSLVSRTWFTPRDVAGELVLSIGVAESARASGVHGTLSDDDGAPMRRAVLVAAAHDDPSALRIPVAAENGAFDSDLVPPGVHQWIAVGARGAVDLGTHTSVAGESLDLGDYRAGATGTLVLRWLTPPPRNEEWSLRWSVQVGAREEKGKVCDLAPPELALPLYPGKYQIDVSSADGSLRCAYTLWITARETLSIEVP